MSARIPDGRALYRRRMILPILLGIAGLIGCQAHETSVRPGVNKEFEGDVNVQQWTERFEGESREIYREREKIVALLGLRQGQSVADIGAGTGFFSLLFSDRVGPAGRVYAVDISEEFVREIERKASSSPEHANITAVLCRTDSVELPARSIDVAFICDTYHHFEFPASTMKTLRKALRPGGVVFVVDFDRIEGKSRQWILDHVRTDQEHVCREIESQGFRRETNLPEVDFLSENYVMKFRRT